MRRVVDIPCADAMLVGTLDLAADPTGLLIMSEGNEIRVGAHRGMAMLAQRVAAAGHPVLRFDRRGVGDSTGKNGGLVSSAPDIAAAAAALRKLARVERVVGFGLGDAATALALFHGEAGIDALVLANPWTAAAPDAASEGAGDGAATAGERRALSRLVSGVLGGIGRSRDAAQSGHLGAALSAADIPITVLTARGDETAIAFRDALPTVPVIERDTDSHTFAAPGDEDWLLELIARELS